MKNFQCVKLLLVKHKQSYRSLGVLLVLLGAVFLLLVFALVCCGWFFLFAYFVKFALECTFLPGDLSQMLRIAFLVPDINCILTQSDNMLNETFLFRRC